MDFVLALIVLGLPFAAYLLLFTEPEAGPAPTKEELLRRAA